jgi:hypothetical protein
MEMNITGDSPMTRREYVLLFLLGLVVVLAMAAFQPSPGYMDADYYFVTGKQLAAGNGFLEPFLWNYLDDPSGLPHPSHLYWMPLAAMLAAAGMWAGAILGNAALESGALPSVALSSTVLSGAAFTSIAQSFLTARLVFLLVAACLPPVTAALACSFGASRRGAWTAGLLALFPGFYLPFLTTTDTFGIYMLLGVLFLQASWRAISCASTGMDSYDGVLKWFTFTGIVAGLMHLARADGALWILVGLAAAGTVSIRWPALGEAVGIRAALRRLKPLAALLLGYLLVISPWFVRNLRLAGSFSAPGASRALWLMSYDEMFIYPASLLTPDRWLASGLGELIGARLWALGQNLQTVLAVQGEVFLVPLVLAGLWRYRHDPRVRIGGLAWALTFLVMTLVFPFQGARGGWFHSGAAVQPLIWALAPAGLQALAEWGRRYRGWAMDQAETALGSGLVGLAVLVTVLTAFPRVIGADLNQPAWGRGEAAYARLEQFLQGAGAPAGIAVLVNNPPGYYGVTDRPALAIPDGDVSASLAVARRYGGAYLLLEPNHPRALEGLYTNPGDRPGLVYLLTMEGTHIFHIMDD